MRSLSTTTWQVHSPTLTRGTWGFVYQNVPPQGGGVPGENPDENAPDTTPPPAPAVNDQRQQTSEAVAHLLRSEELEEKFSPGALEREFRSLCTGAPYLEALGKLRTTLEGMGHVVDLVGHPVESLSRLILESPTYEERNAIYIAISDAFALRGPQDLMDGVAHKSVIHFFTKKAAIDQLIASPDKSDIGDYGVTLDVLLAPTRFPKGGWWAKLAFSSLAVDQRFIVEQIIEKKIADIDAQFPGALTDFQKRLLRKDFARGVKQWAKDFPPEVQDVLNIPPQLPYRDIVAFAEAGQLENPEGTLRMIRDSVAGDIITKVEEIASDSVAEGVTNYNQKAISKYKVMQQIGMKKPGALFSFAGESGGKSVGVIESISGHAYQEDDGFTDYRVPEVRIRAGGETKTFNAHDFLALWNDLGCTMLVDGPKTKEDFFQQYGFDPALQKEGKLLLNYGADDADAVWLSSMNDQTVRVGNQSLTWGELMASLLLKEGVEPKLQTEKEVKELVDTGKKKSPQNNSHKAGFLQSFLATFSSPRSFAIMVPMVIDYVKDTFKQREEERAYQLALNLIPKSSHLHDEIKSKFIGLQNSQMNDRLDALKQMTTGQLAKATKKIIEKSRAGGYVHPSVRKAYLMAILEKGGDLYVKDLAEYRGKWVWYEFFGGKKGDKTYQDTWKNDLETNPDSARAHGEPWEWKTLNNYLDSEEGMAIYGNTFGDSFDGKYNGCGGPQEEKMDALLSDVNGGKGIVALTHKELVGGRIWRYVKGLDKLIDRTMGVNFCFELVFYGMAIGTEFQDKQYKKLKNMGWNSNMPFLGCFANREAVRIFQDAASTGIRMIAKKHNDASLANFDLSTFVQGSTKQQGAAFNKLRDIYAKYGDELFNLLGGDGDSVQVITNPALSTYFKYARDGIAATEGASQEQSAYEKATIFCGGPDPEVDKANGMFNILLKYKAGGGGGGDFRNPFGSVYMNNLSKRLSFFHGIIQNPAGYRDPYTGSPLSSKELEKLKTYYGEMEDMLITKFFMQMNAADYESFMGEKVLLDNMVGAGFSWLATDRMMVLNKKWSKINYENRFEYYKQNGTMEGFVHNHTPYSEETARNLAATPQQSTQERRVA